MKYFPLFFLSCLIFPCAGFSAYLPVVDVTRGDVSARAAFGEEIVQKNTVTVQPIQKNNQKKVVARTAKATQSTENISSSMDVLKPLRPSSDLWARSGDAPLRMPRMDEIAVINSDALLPEESLTGTTPPPVQPQKQEIVAAARPIPVRTPIATQKPVESRTVNVRREIVTPTKPSQPNIAEPKLTSVNEMSKMSPNELKKAFKKTYLSENKHLSTYQMDERYDEVSDMATYIEGFSATRDLSENTGGVRPLEIKISFMDGDSGLSRENYNILSETASIVVNNPKRAVQIAIPESVTYNNDARKLAARRLAIIEQVLRDTGIAENRIVPVLSQRSDDVFVLRIISGDVFETLNQQKRNMFGDSVSSKTYKSMSW